MFYNYFLIFILSIVLFSINILLSKRNSNRKRSIDEKCDNYILYNSSLYSTLTGKGFDDIYIRKYFFTSLKKVYNSKSDKSSIIIDVGSNKGDVTTLFHEMFPDKIILSLEPLINNYNYQYNLLKNVPNIKIYNYGVSYTNETSIIYTGKEIGYMYVKGESNGNNKIEQKVTFVSLDYLLNNICIYKNIYIYYIFTRYN